MVLWNHQTTHVFDQRKDNTHIYKWEKRCNYRHRDSKYTENLEVLSKTKNLSKMHDFSRKTNYQMIQEKVENLNRSITIKNIEKLGKGHLPKLY